MPALDEDEATLAVAAARALLNLRNIEPGTIRRLECRSSTATGWADPVPVALGLSQAALTEGDRGDAGPAPDTLRITSDAPRLGSPQWGSTEALAVAEFPGSAKDIDATHPMTRSIDRSQAEAMSLWNTKAPQQLPMAAYVPKTTWDATLDARYRLVAGFCRHCRRGQHPRLDLCPVCGRPTETRELRGPGSLYTYTIITAGAGPAEFDALQATHGTYGVAIADFGDALRVAGLLTETDLSALAIGQRLEPVFRRLYAQEGLWRYGTKFRAAKQP